MSTEVGYISRSVVRWKASKCMEEGLVIEQSIEPVYLNQIASYGAGI